MLAFYALESFERRTAGEGVSLRPPRLVLGQLPSLLLYTLIRVIFPQLSPPSLRRAVRSFRKMWCLLQTYEGYTGDSCAFSHRVRVPLHQPYGHSPSLRLSNRDGAKVRRRMAHILVRGRPKTTEDNFRRAPVIKFFFRRYATI